MMVVPENADHDEAQHISAEQGQNRFERGARGVVRDFQLKHHDRDDDRQHPIGEGVEAVAVHLPVVGQSGTNSQSRDKRVAQAAGVWD